MSATYKGGPKMLDKAYRRLQRKIITAERYLKRLRKRQARETIVPQKAVSQAARQLSDALLENLKEPLFEAYAVYRYFWQGQGVYSVNLKGFMNRVFEQMTVHPFTDDTAVKETGEKLVREVIG
jgi:ribosomal protein S21